jgi:heme a synthase
MLLHRFTTLIAAATFVLIVAGALVTSTGSGLAVPDWPTSYGYFMYTFPLSYMVGGIFYEHGHRLIASTVGILMIVLAIWLWWKEPRCWVRRLGLVALAAVVVQGVLGGITVLYFLPTPVSVSHAGLAQIFFCLPVSLALFTSPGWLRGYRDPARSSTCVGAVDDRRLRRLAIAVTGLVYLQILVGATMRHSGAGLAIPDFPLVFGGLLPPAWTAAIGVHYAHRIGALIVTVAIFAVARHVWSRHRQRTELLRPVTFLTGLVFVQIVLGGWTVLSGRAVIVNTAHVAAGALVLATSLVITLRAHRIFFADQPGHRTAGERRDIHVFRASASKEVDVPFFTRDDLGERA